MSVRKDSKWKRLLIHLIIICTILISIYPILRVIGTSLRPSDNLHTTSLSIFPENPTLNAYKNILFEKDFFNWLKNSLIVAFFTVIIGITLASTAGYVFSRKKFPGRKAGLLFFLITQMFPAPMLLLPLYLILAKLGLTNNLLGLIVVYMTFALPLCVWQMKGYYDTIPESLEEAALVDGMNQFQAFYKIILPLAQPALAITGLFSFMTAWNEYVVARVVLTDSDVYTLPIGLANLASQFNTDWANFAAASVLIMIPVMAIFLFASRYLVGGLTLGSVKG